MDIILQGLTPILTAGIQTTIIPIIEQNLEKLDSIEGDINQKLDELANKAKTGIDSLPEIPFVFTKEIKETLLKEIPFDKVDQLLDKLDLSAIDKIEIKPIIDDKGVDKTPEIKAKLTQFPNKIREKLKASIRAAFLPGAVANNTQVNKKTEPATTPTAEPATTATKAEPATTATKAEPAITPTAEPAKTPTAEPAKTPTAEPAITPTAEPAITATAAVAEKSIEEGLSNMPNDDKKETIDKIMKMLEDTGILDEIKKRICTPLVEAEAKVVQAEVVEAQTTNNDNANPIATASLAAGGSNKKHRRKTKKNIRRQKRTYTKFGRNF
jgi:hypothetical protein